MFLITSRVWSTQSYSFCDIILPCHCVTACPGHPAQYAPAQGIQHKFYPCPLSFSFRLSQSQTGSALSDGALVLKTVSLVLTAISTQFC